MKQLVLHPNRHRLQPKSTAFAIIPSSINFPSLSSTLFFPACPRPYNFNFQSLRIRYNTNFIKKSFLYSLSSPSHHQIQMAAKISGDTTEEASSPTVVKLKAIDATPESFEEFGQVIEASADGDEFGPRDAQLDLSQGIPRFYIMHLQERPLNFSTITHHASVTQCLGSVSGNQWYLGVAKPSIIDPLQVKGTMAADLIQSRSGHFYIPPSVEDVRVFKISGPKFLKLNRGTWHAGPLFLDKTMDFYNLELSNTNVVDHTTHNFQKKDDVTFSIIG